MTQLSTSILPKATRQALDTLAAQSWLKRSHWYLAGGTALAMQIHHRRSVDLDFFSTKATFSIGTLMNHFKSLEWETDVAHEGTVYGRLQGAKVSFIAYPFFVPQEPMKKYGSVNILAARDIAVMKVVAISQRGRKRDFFDLYYYTKHAEPLVDVLRRLPNQYPTVAHDYHHILKSLLYFSDAEDDAMPRMSVTVSWGKVKTFFRKEVAKAMQELIL